MNLNSEHCRSSSDCMDVQVDYCLHWSQRQTRATGRLKFHRKPTLCCETFENNTLFWNMKKNNMHGKDI